MTGILGWLNAAVVNGENFAGLVNEIRQDEAVKTEIGQAVAVAALDAKPDLIAVEPAIAAGAAAVAGSPLLDGVFTPAIRSFHDAHDREGQRLGSPEARRPGGHRHDGAGEVRSPGGRHRARRT